MNDGQQPDNGSKMFRVEKHTVDAKGWNYAKRRKGFWIAYSILIIKWIEVQGAIAWILEGDEIRVDILTQGRRSVLEV